MKSIVLISRKYDLDPGLFVEALTEALRNDTCEYSDLKISRRGLGQESATFLLTKDDRVVSQFPIRLEYLKDPAFRSHVYDVPSGDLKARQYQRLRRIADLRSGMKRIDVVAKILEVPTRELVTSEFGNQFYVSNIRIADETGSIRLSLWNAQIDKVQVGNNVEIKDCYVTSFAGEPQLRIGRSGTISVV